ncbi:MAG: baseplate J/gp47 family protein [Oscillospiraceae bacterium]|nr:baseplate J/gp47 family protein [Oscillospiraceae bacterium]
MLRYRALDDQRYDDIIAEAKGRLPWLCPAWTDHNAHDPGITILELMAWYKEMQQYQMDRLTPALERALLELAGERPRREKPAECALEFPPDAPERPERARLTSPEGTSFELAEPVPAWRPKLERALIRRGDELLDAAEFLATGTAFAPFAFHGGLLLAFSQRQKAPLRLWFRVETPAGATRNPPDRDSLPPRALAWEFEGAGAVTPLKDETFSLSWSGAVTLPAPEAWRRGRDGLYWLYVRQERAGCEEEARLSGISAGRYRAVQRETLSNAYAFALKPEGGQTIELNDAFSRAAALTLFLRTDDGWTRLQEDKFFLNPLGPGLEKGGLSTHGRRVNVDASGAADDGKPNLLAVCQDPSKAAELRLKARGMPGESLWLNTEGKSVLTENFSLLCQTLYRDGAIRPAMWKPTDALSSCGPRDRVFVWDALRETIRFGDGNHGAVPCPGPVIVMNLALSLCGRGNLPAGQSLAFPDGETIRNSAAFGGQDREELWQCRARLLRRLAQTVKCVSAEDYARCAKATPGLRVAGAKALPGFDRSAPRQRKSAYISVATLPASDAPEPLADAQFLAAVNRQLDRNRQICVQTEAIPVRYLSFSVTARLLVLPEARREALLEILERLFAPREERIGAAGSLNEISAALQKAPGVLQVEQLNLRRMDQNIYENAAGDLLIPPDAMLRFTGAELELART